MHGPELFHGYLGVVRWYYVMIEAMESLPVGSRCEIQLVRD